MISLALLITFLLNPMAYGDDATQSSSANKRVEQLFEESMRDELLRKIYKRVVFDEIATETDRTIHKALSQSPLFMRYADDLERALIEEVKQGQLFIRSRNSRVSQNLFKNEYEIIRKTLLRMGFSEAQVKTLKVYRANGEPNAFTTSHKAGDIFVVLHSGLSDLGNYHILKGIAAHEIGHVMLEHVKTRYFHNLMMAFMAEVFTNARALSGDVPEMDGHINAKAYWDQVASMGGRLEVFEVGKSGPVKRIPFNPNVDMDKVIENLRGVIFHSPGAAEMIVGQYLEALLSIAPYTSVAKQYVDHVRSLLSTVRAGNQFWRTDKRAYTNFKGFENFVGVLLSQNHEASADLMSAATYGIWTSMSMVGLAAGNDSKILPQTPSRAELQKVIDQNKLEGKETLAELKGILPSSHPAANHRVVYLEELRGTPGIAGLKRPIVKMGLLYARATKVYEFNKQLLVELGQLANQLEHQRNRATTEAYADLLEAGRSNVQKTVEEGLSPQYTAIDEQQALLLRKEIPRVKEIVEALPSRLASLNADLQSVLTNSPSGRRQLRLLLDYLAAERLSKYQLAEIFVSGQQQNLLPQIMSQAQALESQGVPPDAVKQMVSQQMQKQMANVQDRALSWLQTETLLLDPLFKTLETSPAFASMRSEFQAAAKLIGSQKANPQDLAQAREKVLALGKSSSGRELKYRSEITTTVPMVRTADPRRIGALFPLSCQKILNPEGEDLYRFSVPQ